MEEAKLRRRSAREAEDPPATQEEETDLASLVEYWKKQASSYEDSWFRVYEENEELKKQNKDLQKQNKDLQECNKARDEELSENRRARIHAQVVSDRIKNALGLAVFCSPIGMFVAGLVGFAAPHILKFLGQPSFDFFDFFGCVGLLASGYFIALIFFLVRASRGLD